MTDPRFHDADQRRLAELLGRLAACRCILEVPALPAQHPEYLVMITDLMSQLGRVPGNRAWLRAALKDALDRGWAAGAGSRVRITWDTGVQRGLSVDFQVMEGDDRYEDWSVREIPFGTHADAKVWRTAEAVAGGDRAAVRVLDVGAGTGRNALALARYGYPVDAVEMVGIFAAEMRRNAAAHRIPVNVIEADIFTAALRDDYTLIVASEIVTNFWLDQLVSFFKLAATRLAPGGQLLVNTFVTKPGYTPTEVARQQARYSLSAFFTPAEITGATAGLGLTQISDESVIDYEKTHLPADAWPPTPWYESWTTGRDVFPGDRESSPIELRWLLYERR